MIIVDVETSGVDPQKHSIISIGALDFNNPTNEFYGECKIWDGAEIMDDALSYNGFSKEDITDPTKQSLEILMVGFLSWSENIEERTLAGHNINFDHMFLKTSAYRYGLNWNFADRTIDVHTLAYAHVVRRGEVPPVQKRRSAINSKFVQELVGIPEEPKPHNALNGTKVAAEALSRLLYSRQLLVEFKEYSIPWIQ